MRVIVIGAGIAGAAAARGLRAQGHEVVVVESADGVGGRTRTVEVDGFRVDTGAIFVMGQYDRTLEFLRESGHATAMGRWPARTAVLADDGRLHRVRFDRPWTLLGLPQLRLGDRLRMAARIGRLVLTRGPGPFTLEELAVGDDGTTLSDWGRRTLGDRGYEYVLRPLMGPLTGADPDVISAGFARALMHQVTRTQLTVPAGGMGAIADWLLQDAGAEVRLSAPARSLAATDAGIVVGLDDETLEADGVVVATDVRTTTELLRPVLDPDLTVELERVTPIRTFHVLLGYHRDPWADVPYDLVVRVGSGRHHDYGVLRNARRAPGSAPPGGETVSVYLDTAQLAGRDPLEAARTAVADTFGPARADVERVFELEAGLIAPTPGHYRRMLALRDAMPDRIRLAGDFLTHSGIEGALRSGDRAAADLDALAAATSSASGVAAAPTTV
jgi:oxygen-dependent protoporphyrinogen oxidase